MDDFTLALDPTSSLSLQHQLRRKLVDAINRGVLRPGRRLPSSRRLARLAGVSRNTVALAYDALLAEGHLVSRARSGVFVASDVPAGRVAAMTRAVTPISPVVERLAGAATDDAYFRCPNNWHKYPYPFIDGCIDPALIPLAEWREAMRLACSRQEALRWSTEGAVSAEAVLAEEIRTKILPAQGIDANADEVLMTLSSRHALQLVAELLVRRATPVVLEEPCDHELRRRLLDRQVEVILSDSCFPEPMPQNAVVFASAQPCARSAAFARENQRALLEDAARSGCIFVEHEVPQEVRDTPRIAPALRALDGSGRVVHVGSLSPLVAPGPAPGMIVADPRFIERARQLRGTLGADLPPVHQHAWAHFISLGHYAAALARARRMLGDRRRELRDALNHYLHKFVTIETFAGASAYWVRGASRLDAAELARCAAAIGVLIEPLRVGEHRNLFRLGVTGIPRDRIRAGIHALSRIIRDDPAQGSRRLADETLAPLDAGRLRAALAGATLLYNTVYGDPCTIEMRRDGVLVGRAGYASEDCDRGRWWIDAGRWFRQWQSWAYGEASGYTIVIDGDQMRLYSADGLLADTAVITRPARARASGRRQQSP